MELWHVSGEGKHCYSPYGKKSPPWATGFQRSRFFFFFDGKLMHCIVPPSLLRDTPSELIFMKAQLFLKRPLESGEFSVCRNQKEKNN